MIKIGGATFIVVTGSLGSSNSARLYEVALENEAQSVFVDSADEFNPNLLQGHRIIGFESGASVEEDVFQAVVKKARDAYGIQSTPFEVKDSRNIKDESRIRFAPVKAVNYEPQFIYKS